MNLKNKRPIFVPEEFRDEIEKLPKAALMDLAWDLATTATMGELDDPLIMKTLRERAAIIIAHRKLA